LIVVGLAAGFAGCGAKPGSTGPSTSTAKSPAPTPTPAQPAKFTFSDFPVPPRPAVTPEFVTHGKDVFDQNCAACHGAKGDGQGQCSAFLVPRPRNFTTAHFRLRSTPSGNLPTDDDLFRAVSLGLSGTPMPPWKWLISDNDRWAVVEYIKTLAPQFADPKADRKTMVDLGLPPPRTDAAITDGKVLYGKLSCAMCHGPEGRGDGPSAYSLTDDSGQHIPARDFSKPSGFKSGYATKEIVRTFLTGLNGTPMPSFNGLIAKDDAWKLAYYVETLVKARRADHPARAGLALRPLRNSRQKGPGR